jgi:hypothetical protein
VDSRKMHGPEAGGSRFRFCSRSLHGTRRSSEDTGRAMSQENVERMRQSLDAFPSRRVVRGP